MHMITVLIRLDVFVVESTYLSCWTYFGKYILTFCLNIESFIVEDKNPSILHNQYDDCWYSGDVRDGGTSIDGIDLNTPAYSSFNVRKVKV